jgi:hypothetical protein
VVYFWPQPEFYIRKIKEFHGAFFAMNFELSNYVADIIKCVIHLPLVMNFKQKDCKIYSFKDRIPVMQYAKFKHIKLVFQSKNINTRLAFIIYLFFLHRLNRNLFYFIIMFYEFINFELMRLRRK